MRRNKKNIVFKPYEQDQLQLFPENIGDLIPDGHLVRLINSAIDHMDISDLLESYKGGGTSSYHPRVLLKILIYGYVERIYTSRKIAKALRENIHFMWLAGGNRPDFRTINRFRSSRLKGKIDQVFMGLMEMLVEAGYVKLDEYFIDGTKIQANANKYSVVWKKNVARYKAGLERKIKELIRQIDQANSDEETLYGDKDLSELGEDGSLSSEDIKAYIEKWEGQLKADGKNKTLSKAVKTLREDYLPRQERYESQEQTLNGRNSYSRTDPDATFMRRKEDHYKNSQLYPAYNVQMGTEDQFIIGYSLHQNPGDSTLLIDHLEHMEALYGRLPGKLITDAGYGSEENYVYLEKKGIKAYVKYSHYDSEKKKSYINNPFHTNNLRYDKSRDIYICPAGRPLKYSGTSHKESSTGYRSMYRKYEAGDCGGCHLRSLCYKGKGNRIISINIRGDLYRQKARDLLDSPEGQNLRVRRNVEVESVFGQLKHNGQFRRFHLRGLPGVHTELGLLAMAHNFKKWHKKELKRRIGEALFIFFTSFTKIRVKSHKKPLFSPDLFPTTAY